MKAVFWHADASRPDNMPVDDDYRLIITDFVKHLKSHNIDVIHLTAKYHEQLAYTCIRYDLNPAEVVASREEAFTEFLAMSAEENETYWFTEPDIRILKPIPKLTTDCAMLYRPNDDVPMTPAWRLATRKAMELFIDLRNAMRDDPRKDWHGDSAAFTKIWKKMGQPRDGVVQYKGVSIEMRPYREYVKGTPIYTYHAVGHARKRDLIDKIKKIA